VDDDLLVARLRKGGATARRLAFGVAKKHLEKGERGLATDWLNNAFYLLPKADQVELLVGVISLYPESYLGEGGVAS
jgi:hypothetical protein